MTKKLISIFVAVMMVLSIIPAAAFASDGNRGAERPNTTASLTLPLEEDSTVEVSVGAEHARAVGEQPGRCYELPSGRYRFLVRF